MATERAGLGAQTFLLPQAQPIAPPQQVQPYDDGVAILEGLQHVQGQTQDWYKKAMALKGFMQSVQKNLGIDVRVPNLARPESIELNQYYQNALADLLAQGNMLKTGYNQQNLNTQMGMQYRPGVDTTQQAVSTLRPGVDYAKGNLDQAVTELNNKLQMPSYTEQEHKDKISARAQLVDYYTKQKTGNPESDYWIDRQISGIIQPTQGQWKPTAPNSYDRRFGKQVSAAGNWVKKITNLQYGAHDSYKADPKDLNENGKPYLVSTEFQNERIGDATVVKWRFDPDTKTTTLLVRDKDGIKSMPITGNDTQVIARDLSKLPTEAIVASQEDNYDEYQQILPEKLLGKDWNKLVESKIGEANTMYNDGQVKEATIATRTALETIKNRNMFTDDDRVQIGKFKIVKRKGGIWEIENIKEALPANGQDAKKVSTKWKDKATWDNLDSLMEFLQDTGAYLEYYRGLNKKPITTGTVPARKTEETNPFLVD